MYVYVHSWYVQYADCHKLDCLVANLANYHQFTKQLSNLVDTINT